MFSLRYVNLNHFAAIKNNICGCGLRLQSMRKHSNLATSQ